LSEKAAVELAGVQGDGASSDKVAARKSGKKWETRKVVSGRSQKKQLTL
jgi:hypothetical protein